MKGHVSAVLMILSLLASLASADASPDTLWTRTFGGGEYDWGWDVQETSDGGHIIVGDTRSFGSGSSDIWLIKTDNGGDPLWTRTFGGLGEEHGYSVRQTDDEGYVIVGTTSSYGAGGYDIWLIKTNSLGNPSWTKTFGGSAWDWGWSVRPTSDDGYILTGYTESYGPGSSAVWLIKTDSAGDTLWTRTFGGSSSEWGESVEQTTDGGYIIAGNTYSYGAGSSDVWLIKTDSLGASQWTRVVGGSNSDQARSVRQCANDTYIVAGHTRSYGAGSYDAWLIKTDSSGDTLWTKTFGGIDDDRGSSVRETADAGYVIVGYTKSYGAGDYDVWLIKTDSVGDSLWTETFGGRDLDRGRSVEQTADGGYIVVGDTYCYEAGEYNVWLLRLGSTCAIDAEAALGSTLSHVHNSPNPFGSATDIILSSPFDQDISLTIYDATGRLVRRFCQRARSGRNRIAWDGRDDESSGLASGTYFYSIRGENGRCRAGRMSLVR